MQGGFAYVGEAGAGWGLWLLLEIEGAVAGLAGDDGRRRLEWVVIVAAQGERGQVRGGSRGHVASVSVPSSRRKQSQVPPHFTLRRHIREQMAFTNPSLVRAATAIHNTLGRAYLAVHMRIGDGVFEWNAPENVRVAWWKLLRGPLRLSDNAIIKLERELFPDEDVLPPPPLPAPDLPALRSPLPPRPPFPTDAMVTSALSCRGPLHTAPHLLSLNAPLYIATDARAPSLDALLWRFVRAFPCAFFLEDFPVPTAALGGLRNEADGVALGEFIMPFLDAMVAGQAWEVVGMEQSTFSAFVVDVLWRKYHGYEIVQRG